MHYSLVCPVSLSWFSYKHIRNFGFLSGCILQSWENLPKIFQSNISLSSCGELFAWTSSLYVSHKKFILCFFVFQNSSPNSSKSLSKAPPPLIPVANGLRPDNLSSHKGVGRNGLDKQRLVDTPAFRPDPTRQEPPYKVRKVCTQLFFLCSIEVSLVWCSLPSEY